MAVIDGIKIIGYAVLYGGNSAEFYIGTDYNAENAWLDAAGAARIFAANVDGVMVEIADV